MGFIRKFIDYFSSAKNLKKIEYTLRFTHTLSDDIVNYVNLEELDVRWNEFREISPNIRNLSKLFS